MSDSSSFDCVVLGGGPAGSTAAALIAEAGFSTLLVEREKMPRFHVGESLMPETYWTLKRLGVLERLRQSAFPKKYSVQFVNEDGDASRPFYFHKHDPRECSQTWQVWRSEFDQILFENAAQKGADCRDRTRVLEVLFEEGAGGEPVSAERQRARGVRIQDAAGHTRKIAARVVIDATGQQSLIATRLGIRREDPHLRKSSIWTYYRGAKRDPGIDAGATIILHTKNKDSWFWVIPLPDDVTSVGVVGDVDYLWKGRGGSQPGRGEPSEVFAEELALCPALIQRLNGAQRTDSFRVAREFSYKATVPAGDGWVLVGDAYGFIDPIYSSGVYFALQSAAMAADCVVAGLRTGDTSGGQLAGWVPGFEAGATLIRQLVDAYYTNHFSFGRFIKAHPQHAAGLTDLLIGRIFHDRAGDIFDDMAPMLAEARRAPSAE
ncbi:MAG: FAD-dependent oxidoreductase [Planctomycetales bacterium]|nr:FAD-dependent oxidoreductase [Planctomycetales bacterium]NIM09760.1 FAD-dependent oxidoreductase [Planctomycetales bacterium]NIN09229.1 FAD-dependent oxidoreductase [Planctomycetales bacterium]NIN78329.1 FAD-dependent oxidoreductase [Planctomycetales bacterium]NIO35508.1 FAD-dependent oxidoreductase [Planctomycetales bacterium]